jgi:Leucine-rich repeat (LRR) protein
MILFSKFCFIFWLIHGTEGQIAKCNYKDQYYWTPEYKTTNVSYYSCNFNSRKANYDEKLTQIDGQHATGYTDADVKLIQNNVNYKLKKLSSIFCEKFQNLEIINIRYAEMESLDEDSMLNCKNLDQLWLHDNKVQELPENLLIRNSKLTYFWLKNSQLTTLPENLFLNQKELESLVLSNNQINFLPSNIFRPLVKLEVLQLYKNKLQSINPEWFVNLQNLKWLGLHGNQISEIRLKCFASLKNLERLWIYENRIKTLNSDNFDGLQSLKILSLGNNEISDLPVGVFAQLKNLQELSLSNNQLTTIHSDSFGVHNQLVKVYLDNNKINAIDEKFIHNTAVLLLGMINNTCSQTISRGKAQVMDNLRNCFTNYQPRLVPSNCGRSVIPQGNIIGGTKIKPNSYPWYVGSNSNPLNFSSNIHNFRNYFAGLQH